MNYIAHINLANCGDSHLLGNFLGDFVKGDVKTWTKSGHNETLSSAILSGIKLHRKIDSYTDSHNINVELRKVFPRSIRRMSGVVIDIYFDHLLCVNWDCFNEQSLPNLLDDFYQELASNNIYISERYQQVKNSLIKHQWLINYQTNTSCLNAYKQIEHRLGKRIEFADIAFHFVSKNHELLNDQFQSFYPDLIDFAKKESKNIKNTPLYKDEPC